MLAFLDQLEQANLNLASFLTHVTYMMDDNEAVRSIGNARMTNMLSEHSNLLNQVAAFVDNAQTFRASFVSSQADEWSSSLLADLKWRRSRNGTADEHMAGIFRGIHKAENESLSDVASSDLMNLGTSTQSTTSTSSLPVIYREGVGSEFLAAKRPLVDAVLNGAQRAMVRDTSMYGHPSTSVFSRDGMVSAGTRESQQLKGLAHLESVPEELSNEARPGNALPVEALGVTDEVSEHDAPVELLAPSHAGPWWMTLGSCFLPF